MNTKLLLTLILIAGISSCTTMYKSGQTPDDVYYSPAIPQNDYVNVDNEEDGNAYNNSSDEDREIRRRINNRRVRVLNDYDYPYIYNYPSPPYVYSYPYYNYPYNYSYYSPIYVNPKTRKSQLSYASPRKYNLGAYGDNANNNAIYQSNIKTAARKSGTMPVRTFNSPATNKNSGVGNFIRRVLTNSSGSNYYNTNDNSSQNRGFQPVRSTTSTTGTNSSSSGSNSGGNVPVRSFHK